jgi:hypothetical protein
VTGGIAMPIAFAPSQDRPSVLCRAAELKRSKFIQRRQQGSPKFSIAADPDGKVEDEKRLVSLASSSSFTVGPLLPTFGLSWKFQF